MRLPPRVSASPVCGMAGMGAVSLAAKQNLRTLDTQRRHGRAAKIESLGYV